MQAVRRWTSSSSLIRAAKPQKHKTLTVCTRQATTDTFLTDMWKWLCSGRTHACTHVHARTHTRLTALFPGLPRWAGTRKVKPIWILLKQETVSGSGISWAICKSAPYSGQTTTPAPHHSAFTGWMPFLPPNQQRQSIEGKLCSGHATR